MIVPHFGVTNRFVRLVLGLACLAAAYRFNTALGLLGLLLIISAIVGWCGLCEAVEVVNRRRRQPRPPGSDGEAT